jgi:hypothetical protein
MDVNMSEGTGFSETWLEDEYDYGIMPYTMIGN